MIWYFYQMNQINPNDDYDDIDWTPSSLGFNIFVTDDGKCFLDVLIFTL